MRVFTRSLFLLIAFFSIQTFASVIPHFHQVTDGIYRGARPETAGLHELQSMGIKTILDLENDDDVIRMEEKTADTLNMNFISKPMSGFYTPDDNEVNEILSIVNDPQNYPVFIHCHHGQDRTGLIVGLYRVLSEKWDANTAYQEMLTNGFHPILFLLDDYYKNKVGLDD